VATWLDMEYRVKELAPDTAVVLRHLRNTQEENRAAIAADAGGIYNCGRPKWVQLFRHRWQRRRGRLLFRERILVEELRERGSIYHPPSCAAL